MEGVGARLGRSSTRYGPTTVFSGPVRKWKKKWVHVSPPNASSQQHHHHHHSQFSSNGNLNANHNGSHLLLYKWTPITQSQNSNNGNGGSEAKTSAKDDDDSATVATEAEVHPPRRKFRYVPVVVLEEQKEEAAEQIEDETKPNEIDLDASELTPKTDGLDGKPDINDVPMEEIQVDKPPAAEARQDLNESTLDLSLGLNAHDGEDDSDMKTDNAKNSQLEITNSSSFVGT